MKSDQTLIQFCSDMHVQVDNFFANWIANRQNDPDYWPITMGEAEWAEQFTTFLEASNEHHG